MKHLTQLRFVFVIIAAVGLYSVDTLAGPTTTEGLYIYGDILTDSRLVCRFRLREPGQIKTIEAYVDNQPLPPPVYTPFGTGTNDTSAFFFLIDSSNPLRQKTVNRNKTVIHQIIATGGDNRRFGVGVFDSRLRVLTSLGPAASVRDDINKALQTVEADGHTTELYRSILEAIKLLKLTQAARKALLVFSDGKKEDTAYSWTDVKTAAQDAQVVIYGLGYAEKKSDTPHLQHLRRLADETGGPYFSADIATGELPGSFLNAPFAFLENGGHAKIDLSGHYAKQTLTLVFKTMDGKAFTWQKQVELPSAPTPTLKPVPTPTPAPELSAYQHSLAWVTANPLPSALTGIVFLGLIITLIVLAAKRRRLTTEEAESDPDVLATLEFLDGNMSRVHIRASALRIGRNPDNDLCLSNDSVSGYHAEMHRSREGRFHITDLESSNGILVNGVLQTQHALTDGDVIALGEVRFRFTLDK